MGFFGAVQLVSVVVESQLARHGGGRTAILELECYGRHFDVAWELKGVAARAWARKFLGGRINWMLMGCVVGIIT